MKTILKSTVGRLSVNFALLLATLLICALTVEILFRTFHPQNLNSSWSIERERGYSLNRPGIRAQHQMSERVIHYRFNSLGLRGEEVDMTRERILLLGDSFTFGWLIDEQHTIPAVLQEKIDQAFGPGRYQVLNGGVGGWGSADYLAFLEEFGPVLKPSVVLVLFNFDDIGRSLTRGLYELSAESLLAPVKPIPTLRSSFKRFTNKIPGYYWLLDNSHFVAFLRHTYVSLVYTPQPDFPVIIDSPPSAKPQQAEPNQPDNHTEVATRFGQALFRRLHAWCESNAAQLLVSTTGWQNSLEPARPATAAFLIDANEFFERENIPFLDISPAVEEIIANRHQQFIVPLDNHPNEQGARVIAEHIWPHLKNILRTNNVKQ